MGVTVVLSCVLLVLFVASAYAQVTAQQRTDLIAMHNDYFRAKADPRPSTPLAPLVWDSTLASAAQTWANGCPKSFSKHRTSTLYGEIVYYGTNFNVPSIQAAIDQQRSLYNFDTKSCEGSVCNYWTQIVSNKATAFGCGWKTNCAFGMILVCNYKAYAQYSGVNPYTPAASTPTAAPTSSPTRSPSTPPTNTPTVAPTETPTAGPTQKDATVPPTGAPTKSPTATPAPTLFPTAVPTKAPTNSPATKSPTSAPTKVPISGNNVDYRGSNLLTPIKNQGSCGSCWAFSTATMFEAAVAKKKGTTAVAVSEQGILDCTSGSCNGGWPDTALSEIIKQQAGKVNTMTSYPYKTAEGTCAYNAAANIGGTIASYGNTGKDKASLLAALKANGPLGVAVNADAKWQSYKSGILSATSNSINHAVVLVGFDEAKNAWIIRNSWGTSWGMSGYCYVDAANPYGIQLYGGTYAVGA